MKTVFSIFYNLKPEDKNQLEIKTADTSLAEEIDYPLFPDHDTNVLAAVASIFAVIWVFLFLSNPSVPETDQKEHLPSFFTLLVVPCFCFAWFFLLKKTKYKKKIENGEFNIAIATITDRHKKIVRSSDDHSDTTTYYLVLNHITLKTNDKTYSKFHRKDEVTLIIVDDKIIGMVLTTPYEGEDDPDSIMSKFKEYKEKKNKQ